jgi:hypothetical protein
MRSINTLSAALGLVVISLGACSPPAASVASPRVASPSPVSPSLAPSLSFFGARSGGVAGVQPDLADLAADRGIDVAGGLDRFHDRAGFAGLDPAADRGQFDEHHIGQLMLGVVGDAHRAGVAGHADPLVRFRVFQIGWNLGTHKSSLRSRPISPETAMSAMEISGSQLLVVLDALA